MTILPDKTTAAILWSERKIGLVVLNVALMILLTATMLPQIHCAAGTVLLIGCAVHLALHRSWINAVIWNSSKNITATLCHQRRLFWGLLLAGFICGLSGWVILLGNLLSALQPHFFLPLYCCGTPIHVLSGLAFWGLNIYHLVLHRNWFRKNLTIQFSPPR